MFRITKLITIVLIAIMASAMTPSETPTIEENYCATWRSQSYNSCEHQVRVDNGCYNRVHFRITVSDGRYWDYYVNPGAYVTVPVGYCGQWYFKWL